MAQLTCARCQLQAEGLDRAPLSGQLGQLVLGSVCRDCWQEWMATSVTLINHYGLHPVDPEDRQRLYQLMREFLGLPAA